MSYYEFHKGKVKILTRTNEETAAYIKEHHLEDIVEESGKVAPNFYCDRASGYIVLEKEGDKSWEDVHMLGILMDYEEVTSGSADKNICCVTRESKDIYSFVCSFYNGGTYLEEQLSKKIAEYEKEEYKDIGLPLLSLSYKDWKVIRKVFDYQLRVMKSLELKQLDKDCTIGDIEILYDKFCGY